MSIIQVIRSMRSRPAGEPVRDRGVRLQERTDSPLEGREVRPPQRMNSPLEKREVRLRGRVRGVGVLLVVVASVVAAGGSAAAQVPEEQARKTAEQAIGNLRSPFCPGLMLEVCPSPNAEALRDTIRMAAAQGQRANQIVEGVLARHGEEWRAVPKRSGAGLLAWLMLPFALVAGGVFVWSRVRAMRAQGQVYAVAAGQGVTDDERARLDAALREFDRREDDA
jgi:cytochrome c-type biogenesis protein CcmH/NrfF